MIWKEFVSVFAQELLVAIAVPLAGLLAGLLIAKIKQAWASAESKIDERYVWMIDEAVRVAVLAAEQSKLAEHIDNKKEYAIDAATRYLEARGFKIDLALISDRIEAAVMELFNKGKVVPEEGVG